MVLKGLLEISRLRYFFSYFKSKSLVALAGLIRSAVSAHFPVPAIATASFSTGIKPAFAAISVIPTYTLVP